MMWTSSFPLVFKLDLTLWLRTLIKKIAIKVSVPLAHIFNLSLTTGIFPSNLKLVKLYQSIWQVTLNCVTIINPYPYLARFSKIMGKMVSFQLVNHLDRDELVYDNQFGFQSVKSTEHNLIEAVNYVKESTNNDRFCNRVLFDFKKTFDVVSHYIFLKKTFKIRNLRNFTRMVHKLSG